MKDQDQALALTYSSEKFNCWQKSALIYIFDKLKYGSFDLYENNKLIKSFGEPNSNLKAELNVVNSGFYKKLLYKGSIGVGESYIDGDWTTSDLTQVVRIFARNLEVLDEIEKKFFWITNPLNRVQHWKRRNSKSQAKNNIMAHYDLGNELYKSFLDPSLLYSSAIYSSNDMTLEEAQQNKLRTICEKLNLTSRDHLVEIGTGWGALAIFAAQNYGCHVTTTTISNEQFEYTKNKVKELGLENQITLLKKDYRELTGQYDKLVSIEMIEAVGERYLDSFIQQCQSLLKPEGRMLLQAITIADQRMELYKKSVDYIQKYIFPGGFLPSIELLSKKFKENTDMVIRDVHDIGIDYALTLREWRNRFNNKSVELKQLGYDQKFSRLWNFYLQYCEAGFLERTISTVQVVLTRKHHLDQVAKIR